MKNYDETNNESFNKEELFKIITSIFKKTLFILEKFYSETNVSNLNKNFKQIYMNLFACIKIISPKFIIIDSIINQFFNIIISYYNYIFDLINKRKAKSNETSLYNEDDINNDIKINLSFLSGIIDFLLSPELYDFNNTRVLMALFDKLSIYFNFQGEKEVVEIINQHFYFKLLSFTPKLNKYFENDEVENKLDFNNNDDINIMEKKRVMHL